MSLVCSIFIGEFFAKRFETFNIVVNVCLKETLRGRRMSLVECRIIQFERGLNYMNLAASKFYVVGGRVCPTFCVCPTQTVRFSLPAKTQ